MPVLNQPANYSFGASSVRVLKWNAQSDGIIYRVQVSTDSTFATTYRTLDVGTNQYTVTGLVSGSTYYWRVKSNNGGDTSAYSTIWNFTISATGIDDYEEADLITIAPNPSAGDFLFSELPPESTIEIFDITGRSISKTKANGSSCKIDLTANAKGIYFYSISNRNRKIKQGKLILE